MCFILLLVRQYEVDPKVKEWSNTLPTLLLLVGSYVVGHPAGRATWEELLTASEAMGLAQAQAQAIAGPVAEWAVTSYP